jgi:4-hydroxybenzoate polyprenyltransferase
VLNDLVDLEVDKISNNRRPLLAGIYKHKEYAQLGYAFFGLSLLGGLVVGFKFFSIMLVYQFLAWAYSAKPYRLKRFPLIATLLSAAVLILVLFAGFTLFSGDNNIQGLSWRVILLFLIALTLSLPIKDFKDIEGDKKEGIWTIPVIFGEENGRLIVATGIFISFMASVFLLNEFRLFWWAIILGALSFWIVLTKKPRQLFWWVLGTVSVYGLILVKILFS